MLTVEYPPGAVEHVHRHDAYAFVYVLEGTIVEGVRGGKEVTLDARADFLRRSRRCAHGRAQREHDGAGKIPRGHGEEEGRRRGVARRVALRFARRKCRRSHSDRDDAANPTAHGQKRDAPNMTPALLREPKINQPSHQRRSLQSPRCTDWQRYPAASLNLAAAASGVRSRWGEPSISKPTMNFRMVAERSSGG